MTLAHRNVCKDGFTVMDQADAGLLHFPGSDFDDANTFPVFLDLPAPWDAVEHARRALRVSVGAFPHSLLQIHFKGRKTKLLVYVALAHA